MMVFKSNNMIYPADRCVWNYDEDGEITFVTYHNGSNEIILEEAELGYIGKSGRFIPIQ